MTEPSSTAVMNSTDFHTERERAEGFGAAAAAYDAWRPSYPAELIQWLSRDGAGRAVDVGCGTGRVAVLLRAAGWTVTGVEPDARMAGVARSHGIEVIDAPFEHCPLPQAAYDLVCSGTAWHWVDPAVGYRVAAALLRPRGRLAVFRNIYQYDSVLAARFAATLERHAPQLVDDCIPLGTTSHEFMERRVQQQMEQSGRFVAVLQRIFAHTRQVNIPDWTQELATFSQIAALDAATRAALLADLARDVQAGGGPLHIRQETRYVEALRGD